MPVLERYDFRTVFDLIQIGSFSIFALVFSSVSKLAIVLGRSSMKLEISEFSRLTSVCGSESITILASDFWASSLSVFPQTARNLTLSILESSTICVIELDLPDFESGKYYITELGN